MFYNCENLLFSQGHTYEKLNNLSRVIIAAGEGEPPAIVGLAEVENDSILQRWTQRTALAKWHYDYVISRSNDERGINVAMLYQKDQFRLIGQESVQIQMPKGIRPTRDLLHVWGKVVSGDTLDVIVCHLPSRYNGKKSSDKARHIAHIRLKALMDSICVVRQDPKLVVCGDFNDYPNSKLMKEDFQGYINLMDPLQRALKKGKIRYGSHKHEGEWGFLDQFLVNESLVNGVLEDDALDEGDANQSSISVANARSFVLPFMLTEDKKYLGERPKRSRYGSQYEGGCSDHLPIVLDLFVHELH